MIKRILCVDDEPNVLQGLERQLRKQFEIATAEGPLKGLEAIEDAGPFAVIVSDLRMPVMTGIEFLAKAKERTPDSIRIVLSGQGDFATVIDAVNEGSIFRFLTKPCSTDQLAKTLTAALEQYRLVQAERELLEHTLSGCIELLSEVLSITNPSAFSRSHRIRHYVRHMTDKLAITDSWQYEVAAMLSQIGCVTISPDVLERAYEGIPLTKSEAQEFASQYDVAARLLNRIPRFEQIARIIGTQQSAVMRAVDLEPAVLQSVEIGVELLQIASEFDQGIVRGQKKELVLSEMRARRRHNLQLIATLQTAMVPEFETQARLVGVHELRSGMVINGEVRAKNGLLLFAKGQEVTEALIERLKNFAVSAGVIQPFSVVLPGKVPLEQVVHVPVVQNRVTESRACTRKTTKSEPHPA